MRGRGDAAAAGDGDPADGRISEQGRGAEGDSGEWSSIFERERRVIGAIAKPLYEIGGKAGGLDRRVNPVRWR